MRALESVAHPVRLRIVQRLADDGPASLTELAKHADVHEETARAHIAALEAGGLIASERRPLDRPGRPGINYKLADAALLAPSGLAQLLVAALSRAGVDPDALRATGHAWGTYLTGRPGSHDIAEKLPEALEQIGYSATLTGDAVELRHCPCPAVSPDNPKLVCCLAEGVVSGVVAASGADRTIGSSEHDPQRRQCRIELVKTGAGSRPARPRAGSARRKRAAS